VDESDCIEIQQGRHPVIEQLITQKPFGLAGTQHFVCNDTHLSSSKNQIAIITGPNMAGKSTYIRQIAIIVILAHSGCWVPASKAHIGRIDRIFSRIGAGDDLSQGKSTFLVEMEETAAILRQATPKSLVILDEVGRGTSTYDGLSIAWAVVEYLHGSKSAGPMTLFATHYQEITQLENSMERVKNFHMKVQENGDNILFLREVAMGSADRSYGIQVAKLAGIPHQVIERAKDVLSALEENKCQFALRLQCSDEN
jgi:DNA mismatch repair protein MutS